MHSQGRYWETTPENRYDTHLTTQIWEERYCIKISCIVGIQYLSMQIESVP
jgi:hypothetical protein